MRNEIQQTSCMVSSGLTSHLDSIACLLMTLEKFRWSRRNHECNEEDLEPFYLGGASRCATRGYRLPKETVQDNKTKTWIGEGMTKLASQEIVPIQ
jgi:hypothetical protein